MVELGPSPIRSMARLFGFSVALIWTALTVGALRRSLAGWSAGQTDIGFWWAVIAGFLGIATLAALVGTALHTRKGAAH